MAGFGVLIVSGILSAIFLFFIAVFAAAAANTAMKNRKIADNMPETIRTPNPAICDTSYFTPAGRRFPQACPG